MGSYSDSNAMHFYNILTVGQFSRKLSHIYIACNLNRSKRYRLLICNTYYHTISLCETVFRCCTSTALTLWGLISRGVQTATSSLAFKLLQIWCVCIEVLLLLTFSCKLLPFPLWRYRCAKLMHIFPVVLRQTNCFKSLARIKWENVQLLCTAVSLCNG